MESRMDLEALKPCPFCGSPAEWEDDLHLNCGCSGGPNCPGSQEWHPHDQWQNRAPAEQREAPEPAPGEGSPSQPSSPSQDSQEVREAVHRLLRSYRCQHTKDEDGDGASLLDVLSPGETVAGGMAEIELLTDEIAETVALLSQSPKGAAGAGRECWVLEVRGELKAPEGLKWKTRKEVEDYIADVYEPGSTANPKPVRMVEAAGGESGPSAPKTGLRGAPRQEEKDFSPQWTCMGCGNMERGTFRTIEHRGDPAEPVDYDLECTKCGNLDIAESPEEALSRLTTDCDTLRAENETLKAAKPPLSEAKGPDLPPSSQPAPGDVGEAGGAA